MPSPGAPSPLPGSAALVGHCWPLPASPSKWYWRHGGHFLTAAPPGRSSLVARCPSVRRRGDTSLSVRLSRRRRDGQARSGAAGAAPGPAAAPRRPERRPNVGQRARRLGAATRSPGPAPPGRRTCWPPASRAVRPQRAAAAAGASAMAGREWSQSVKGGADDGDVDGGPAGDRARRCSAGPGARPRLCDEGSGELSRADPSQNARHAPGRGASAWPCPSRRSRPGSPAARPSPSACRAPCCPVPRTPPARPALPPPPRRSPTR